METRFETGITSLQNRPARGLWLLVILMVLSTMAGTGSGPMEPKGKTVGLIQFDVITELFANRPGVSNIVVFARHWVCPEYYAVSFPWVEFPGQSLNYKGQVVFSDEAAFNIDDELSSHPRALHASHPKPLGSRPPLRHFVGTHYLRFAESETLSKRVYIDNFASAANQNGTIDVNVPDRSSGVSRKLGRLKAQVQQGQIESMELLDKDHEPLTAIRYEYDRRSGSDCLSKLVAQLPVRSQEVVLNAEPKVLPSGEIQTSQGTRLDYVRHKGGRTCTVHYQDVVLGAKHLRLPVKIEVRRSDTQELLRSARLMNFKQVDLDKAGVRRAAAVFAGPDPLYDTRSQLISKFLNHEPKLGPPSIDPNNLAAVRQLIAKYPFFERPLGPKPVESEKFMPPPLNWDGHEQWRQEQEQRRIERSAERQKRADEWRERVAQMPRPPRQQIGEDDTRLIRQLYAHYEKVSRHLTEPQKEAVYKLIAEGELVDCFIPPLPQDARDLYDDLEKILRYHRFDPLKEDQPPEPNASDVTLIRELREHYERISQKDDRGLGGKFRAVHSLMSLDRTLKDWDTLERHVRRYLQMMAEAELNEMYLMGGIEHIEKFIGAGRYGQIDRLIPTCAGRAVSVNPPESIFRWCGPFGGADTDPWLAVEVLDYLLKRSDLSVLQRYEALAWRAIFLDKIDRFLADPKTDEDPARAARKRWILSHATKAQITELTLYAVVNAAQAWGALGPARYAEAKPYSTENMNPSAKNIKEAPDATRLQEVSAKLDAIVGRRTPPKRPSPRLDAPGWRRRSR